jgi:hypothetical protein
VSRPWQYRLKLTNRNFNDTPWHDVGDERWLDLQYNDVLQFRPKPRRSLVAAMRSRAGSKQQRGGGK